MAIYRGPGGAGDAVADTSNQSAAAVASASAAATSASNAATSATNAASSASAAATSATAAANSATSAASSASSASSSASSASSSASAASSSASSAASSASAASDSEDAAAASEAAAATSETNAASSESAAASSASSAASSASSAASSATDAAASLAAIGTAVTDAADSATAAAASASDAADSATAAAASEAAVAADAATASAAASAASTSETNAATSETNAASSASAASTSASNAATSETNAANSATAAASSATTAGIYAANAAASYDSFDDRYLGSKSSDPTLDNDGNALVTGALYYNTTDGVMKIYTGTGWIAAASSLAATLTVFEFVATSGQTAFTGTDANGETLAFTDPNLIVTLNGVRLRPGDDFTASAGTTVTLVSAATTGDELVVDAFGNFEITNALLSTENLADLGNAATARTNLGLGTAATTASTDYATAAQGALADSATQPGDNVSDLTNDAGYLTSYTETDTLDSVTGRGASTTNSVTVGGLVNNGNTTLGDASGDAVTINASTVSTPNGLNFDSNTLVINAANNNVGIGTSSPSEKLEVDSGDILIDQATGGSATLYLTGSSTADRRSFVRATRDVSGNGHSLILGTNANGASGTERMRITSEGYLLLGGDTSVTGVGNTSQPARLCVQSSTGGYISMFRNDTTIVDSNVIGAIAWHGNDTTSNTPTQLAYVSAVASGTHAAGDNPTDLVFGTTADGTETVAEKMRIDSSGNVGIGTSSPLGKLKVVVGDNAPAASGNMNTGVIYESGPASRAINFGVNNTAGYSWINAAFANNSGVADNLVLMTGATERMRIDNSGNVGIGTSSPAAKLHVVNTAYIKGSASTDGDKGITIGSGSGAVNTSSHAIRTGGGLGDLLIIETETANSSGQIVFNTNSAERMRISSTGGLSVGTTANPGAGAIYATGNITAYYSSDARLKENVKDVDNALDKVCAIGSKTFDWTDEYIASKGGEDGYFVQKADFGVVAQDVQAVFPQAVRTREDGTLAVDYEKLATLAFGAIKELVKRVEALEAK